MPSREDYIIIGAGALVAVLLSSYVPVLVKVSSTGTPNHNVQRTFALAQTLETIPGIDLNSLNLAKLKGLM